MEETKRINYIKDVLENMPTDWLNLTTHQLDIYNEKLAKTQFLDQFETLFNNNNTSSSALSKLPTAYDYIRLGHPLSCVLEWTIANLHQLTSESVISFSSQTVPVLAILRKNLLENKKTQIVYTDKLPTTFDADISANTFTLELKVDVDGYEELLWHGYEDGEPVTFDVDPYTGFWRRFGVGFMSILPIESQL